MDDDLLAKFVSLVNNAARITIIQPNNPDGDSLGSALALEQILSDLGKQIYLFCGISIPNYLRYLPGWDRVNNETALVQSDLFIIVDTSTMSLLDRVGASEPITQLIRRKPLIIIDHHVSSDDSLAYAAVSIKVPTAAATGEVIYDISGRLGWEIKADGKYALAAAILSDSLGLTTPNTTGRTIHIIGELVEGGVSIPALERARRDYMRKSPELVHYKGELLQRIEYYNDDKLALLCIPWEEIEKYSPQYNPSMLAIEDMRLTTNTIIVVALKSYQDGHFTAKIRTNYGSPVAAKLAEKFGGGGHEYASGFKLTGGTLSEIKNQVIEYSRELLLNETV